MLLLTISGLWVCKYLKVDNFNGEFDPGSELTLASCITHASRTGLTEITSNVSLVADG